MDFFAGVVQDPQLWDHVRVVDDDARNDVGGEIQGLAALRAFVVAITSVNVFHDRFPVGGQPRDVASDGS
jgi:hypothetical protein